MMHFIQGDGCPCGHCCGSLPSSITSTGSTYISNSVPLAGAELPEEQSMDSAIRAMLGGLIRAYIDMVDEEEDSYEATLARAANELADDEDEIHTEFEYNCPHCNLPN